MKMYHWINSYTAGGQNSGIQTAHAQVGLIEHHGHKPEVQAWIKDKTTVVLKGGTHANLMNILSILERSSLPYYAFFESLEALNGALTNVCFLPTERIINAAAFIRKYGKKACYSDDKVLYIALKSENQFHPMTKEELRDLFLVSSTIQNYEMFCDWEKDLIFLIAEGRTA